MTYHFIHIHAVEIFTSKRGVNKSLKTLIDYREISHDISLMRMIMAWVCVKWLYACRIVKISIVHNLRGSCHSTWKYKCTGFEIEMYSAF